MSRSDHQMLKAENTEFHGEHIFRQDMIRTLEKYADQASWSLFLNCCLPNLLRSPQDLEGAQLLKDAEEEPAGHRDAGHRDGAQWCSKCGLCMVPV